MKYILKFNGMLAIEAKSAIKAGEIAQQKLSKLSTKNVEIGSISVKTIGTMKEKVKE